MSQMYIPNIKQRDESGKFNTMLTLGILDIAPKGIYSFPLENRPALHDMQFYQMSIFPIWMKPIVIKRLLVG